jgi:SAM-dependent methyltransferase
VSAIESGYRHIDGAPDPAQYIHRLDRAGATGFWHSTKLLSYDLLGLTEGVRVLDVGCGPGADVVSMAELIGTGCAIGIDSSLTMIAEAERRRPRGSAARIEYRQADATRLPFASAHFDACRVERVLQHLADPRGALAEMARVSRSKARIVAIEPDHASLRIVGADAMATRAILGARRAHFASPDVGSRLGSLMRDVELVDVRVRLRMLVSTDFQIDRGRLAKYAHEAVVVGAITEAQGTRWLSDLSSSGRYRHAGAVYVAAGCRR